jgi:hypothetical protein
MLIRSGNEIPVELIQTVLKMAPTSDEELKLRLFTGEVSQLGPAERFLKTLVDIPLAFKRLESLLFMFTLREEASSIKECFTTLEVRIGLFMDSFSKKHPKYFECYTISLYLYYSSWVTLNIKGLFVIV